MAQDPELSRVLTLAWPKLTETGGHSSESGLIALAHPCAPRH